MKRQSFTVLILVTSIFLLEGCQKNGPYFKDDELSLPRQDYLGQSLRMDGYYYLDGENGVFRIIIFYRDGVLIDAGGAFDKLEESDQYITENFLQDDRYTESKLNWGVFIIDGSTIRCETWYPTSGGGLPAYVSEGLILNDTTFRVIQGYRSRKGKKINVSGENRLYRFRKFSPKPDSTNDYVQ